MTAGQIYIDGVANTEMDVNELRRNIGYAIQEIGLFPHMTVGENIETVPMLKGWLKERRRKRAEELLELVGMNSGELVDKYPGELSGGQAQRVGVARALGADPPILLMDEPFGAIDPITRARLQDEFLKIQQQIEKTVILVTHDIYEAIKMGDKIALMREGRLVQYDTPTNLVYRPKNEFVENFIGADRVLKGLQLLRVKDVMDSSTPAVKADEKMEAVRERMESEEIDWLAVIDADGKFLGWVSKTDMERGDSVGEVMNPSTATAKVNTILSEALSLMLGSGLKNLPIVNKYNRLQGVISFDTIQQTLTEVAQRGQLE
jgi:osmoprotectant transport system ATP-binding protein